jgi:hypothetical protein
LGDYSTEQLWKDCYAIWDAAYRARLEVARDRAYRFDRFTEMLCWYVVLGLATFALTVIPVLLLMVGLALA